MKQRRQESQTGGRVSSQEHGERQGRTQVTETEGCTNEIALSQVGLVSLMVPVVLPLVVLAIVLMANLTLARADADARAGNSTGLEAATTLEGRNIK